MTPLVIVVGAGPAGLAAATEAARAGAAVRVLDERPETGGQLLYRAQPVAGGVGRIAERPHQLTKRLVDEARAAGVDLYPDTLVAGWFAGNELLVVEDGRASRLTTDALIVSTGSTDLPYPFAGATFPGVFSARGLRILLHQHRVRPGQRFAVIGGGVDAEELAVDIVLAGGEVVWSGIAPAPFLRAEGADGVRSLAVGQDQHTVDVIAIAVGRQPDPALATMAGVPLAFSAEFGGWVPIVDDRMQSSTHGLFVAGDAAGVGSVASVIAEGRLAGIAAAASLGQAGEAEVTAIRAAGGPELSWRLATRASLEVATARPYE